MAIIYSYPINGNIQSSDLILGVSTIVQNGRPKNQTKSFEIGELAAFINLGNTLNTVLNNGNTSLLDAKIGELYLYDTTEQEYGKIRINDSTFSFYNNLDGVTNLLSKEGVTFFPNAYSASILATTITESRTYQLPDQPGTIALISDIPGTPTLNEVLYSGNESLLNAKIGELYLYDNPNSNYAKISIQDDLFSVIRATSGTTMFAVDNGNTILLNNGTANAVIVNSLTTSRTYTLPNATGTFALTSDIPTTPTLQEVCNAGATVINAPILLEDLNSTVVLSVVSELATAISGQSAEGWGVRGNTDLGYAVYGSAQAGYGGYFTSDNGVGGFFSSGETYSLIAAQSAAKPGGGSWSVYSDLRIKENIVPYTKGLSDILLINPVNYEYNGLAGTTKGKKYTGIIAQEIKEVFPDTVNTYKAKLNEEDKEKTELYDFNSSDLTFALINAVKELNERIAILENK